MREDLTIKADTSLPSARVMRILDQDDSTEIVLDSGPELVSRILDEQAAAHGIRLGLFEPSKQMQHSVMGTASTTASETNVIIATGSRA